MGKFFTASDDEILNGRTTDIYFIRTKEILKSKGIHKHVRAEFTVSKLPSGYNWAVFAGLEEALRLLEGKPIDVYALPEGTIFTARDVKGIPIPVMFIEGDYMEFAIYETPTLGFLCQSSGIATKSARVRVAAGDSTVLSFGIRRMHPAIAPLIDRNAYIGGCDGVSSIVGAETIGQPPKGTMPHALMITMGEEEAWKAYDEVLPPKVPRIVLIDTFGDEKWEAIKAAQIVKDIMGIRLDTPGSRKGNFPDIIREVRWELDIRGFKHVQLFISGGLDEHSIPPLKEAGATGFGVGTSISNAPTIDYAMDIVAVEGKPLAKKGKFGGIKHVKRCQKCGRYHVFPEGEAGDTCSVCGGELVDVHRKFIENGKIIAELPSVEQIRSYVLEQISKFELTIE